MNIKKTYEPNPIRNKLFTGNRYAEPVVFAGSRLCAGELRFLCGTNTDFIGMQLDLLFTGITRILKIKNLKNSCL